MTHASATEDTPPSALEETDETVAGAFARRLADCLPGSTAAVLGALDVGSWGWPGRPAPATLPLVEAPGHPRPRATVRFGGENVVVAVTPGYPGPCPGCLDSRWLGCRPRTERHVLDQPHGVTWSTVAVPPPDVVRVTAGLLAAAAGWLDAQPAAVSHPVWEMSRGLGDIRRYGLIRSSDCPVCHRPEPDTKDAAQIQLEPCPVEHPGDTRVLRPESLELPMEALANPVCGVLGGPAVRAYNSSATAPTSGFFQVRSKYGLHDMWWSGHAESFARSEILGALEGLERLAGQRNRRQPAIRASVQNLGAPFVAVEDCGTYHPDFYLGHAEQYVSWQDVPSVPWVWGWSLRDQRSLLVPEQLVYYLDHREDHRNTVQECSNGCASGSSVTEAILHGLLELIERDAFLLSWYAGVDPPEIDLDTVQSPLVQQMRAHLDLLGYDLRCFDVRVDLPVPAVGGVAVRRDGGTGTLCFAGGASLDPLDAVRAAVCEVASYVPGFAERVRRNLEPVSRMVDDYRAVTELEHHALLFGMPEMARHAEHWLRPRPSIPVTSCFGDWTTGRQPASDLRTPIEEIVALLAARGMDTVVVDQTTSEQASLGVHTVSVLVPGLIPIDFGWQRQRVLTMPRTLLAHHRARMRSSPLTADGLHAVPHPFP